MTTATLDVLARALDRARATRSRIGKEVAIAEALRAIAATDDDVALATAARLATLSGLPVVGVGGSVMGETIAAATKWSIEVVGACARRTGDLGEAFGLLLARRPEVADRVGVPLGQVASLFEALTASGNRLHKRRRLDEVFARTTAMEAKYLCKALLGELRVGVQGGAFEGAIVRAFERPVEAVRRAAALVTDPGALVLLARDDRLGDAKLEIGRPVAYMLATPMEAIAAPIDLSLHVAEDKIDGVRSQVHKVGGDVFVFARGLEEIGVAFPEVVDAFRFIAGSIALDGELVVLGPKGRPRPFQALQRRLRKLAPTRELLESAPVTFVAYDLLADDDGDHLSEPWRDRRRRLEAFARDRAPPASFVLNDARPATVLDEAFDAARARGQEGLVLKRVDAPYDPGRRGQAWIKVKKAFGTLDVVITAAEEGHGRRAGVLSDYTFAVWREGELVNVGKAYSGLTDEEIDAMTRRLERITVARYGRVRAVKPDIVLEVAFEGVQPSSRHKSGFALRFPRIARIRDDKRPEEADGLSAVEALYRAQIETGHREHAEPPTISPAARKRRSRAEPPAAQLGLFDVRRK